MTHHKVAFCFLVYDSIIRYDIWNTFFKNIDEDKYTVFIHPKNISSKMERADFKYNIVKNRINTKSKDHISIVEATLILLEEASAYDENISHFIFLSQSCIPIYNFNILYDIITKFPYSVISYIDNNKKERYNQLSNTVKRYFDISKFIKQQPNMILTKEDVIILLNNNLTAHFNNMQCPDEHYFINVLLNIFKRHVIRKQINFCNNDMHKTQALEFNYVDTIFINNIRKHGFLFMRKVTDKSIINF